VLQLLCGAFDGIRQCLLAALRGAFDGIRQCLLAALRGIQRSPRKPGVCVLMLYCVLANVLAYALHCYALDIAVL